ncbi:hypothetical protein GOP47_0011562 [Adiantum capillus-veneris]|uniref:glucan endo-1,3-beta-D-glucosidase n=1 Tax=Adiantum capillus-veneris TaxID=13818 RepID=A0A9D4UT14_ADICA|nr:hypothetical protein GOP47_0011562 [Adiantum capillus-veneris]
MKMWKHDHFQEAAGVPGVLLRLLVACTIAGWGFERAAGITFGVNYGKIADNLPAPSQVVGLLQSISITKSKLYDVDPVVLKTFSNTGISFIVGTYNNDLLSLTNPELATSWVQTNIVAHLPGTDITGIVVGNEIFSATDTNLMAQVLPAMKNVYAALKNLNLHRQIFVSTAHSFSILSSSFPPSKGAFNPAIATLYIQPILEFLDETGAPFLINVYPFFAYKDNPTNVSLAYVLFQTTTGVLDENTELHYYNMFDAQMDSVYSAISALGYTNITLLVSETGWPSLGDVDEPGATIANAQTYHANLVKHVTSKKGTPLRPDITPEVYLFALFNEDQKPGPTSERNYGLFHPDGSKVYEFSFSQSSQAYLNSAPHGFTMGILYFMCVFLAILTSLSGIL